MKPAIQLFGKVWLLFVAVNQIGRPGWRNRMPSSTKRLNLSWFREFFTRKNQGDVPALILHWHIGCKRAFTRHPTYINTLGWDRSKCRLYKMIRAEGTSASA